MAPEPKEDLYHVERWSEGYFGVNKKGHVCLNEPISKLQIDIMDVISRMSEEGIQAPAVIRFHDVLQHRIRNLNETFNDVLKENNYNGLYYGVYPIKVNQMREVVEEIVDASGSYNYGLEAGSKAELLAVLAYNTNRNALTIVNGYKDDEFISLALLGQKLGHRVIIVIESVAELQRIIRVSKPMGISPEIGVRIKISARGIGKWAASSGEQAKFGLTLGDVMNALTLLKDEKMVSCLKLLHFHLGSQVGDVSTFRDALSEATRVYCELRRLGAELEFLDVGGGLAIDYDGSRSTRSSSCNYTLREYAQNIISQVLDICRSVGTPEPHIVTESGRFITAHHSCIVTEVLDVISPSLRLRHHTPPVALESPYYERMQRAMERIGRRSLQSVFHELKGQKEEVVDSFRMGLIGLEELTLVEELYWEGIERLRKEIRQTEHVPEELLEVEKLCNRQYLCNFSVFQSAADSWAVGQLLPIVPLHRHNEEPTMACTIADITCDSDGKIDKFINGDGRSNFLHLHELKTGEPYYLGIFLTGAYQDVMGDMHNLFGRLNEVHVYAEASSEGNFYIEETIKGSSKSMVLSTMQYHVPVMSDKVMSQLNQRVQQGLLSHREAKEVLRQYNRSLRDYTYLEALACPKS
jgi:arginine decarboxylase